MAQYKTIDRRKAAMDDASVVKRLTGQMKTATPVSAGATPAQNQNAQTYYSPREYGSQSQALGARASTARKAMEEQSAALEQSRKAMERLYAQTQEKKRRYYALTGSFMGESAADYEKKLVDEWTEALDLYDEGRAAYQKAYDAYKPYEDEYNAAVAAYNEYQAQEQAAYSQWRSTVRDADAIRQERSEIQGKRAELERLMKENNRLNDPGQLLSGADVTGRSTAIAGNETRIRELQAYLGAVGDREKLLEEELDWSERLRWEDLRQNADFAQGSQYQAERFQDTTDDYLYNWINTNGGKIPDNAMYNAEGAISRNRYMSRDEIAMYNYLYSTRGADGAREYLDYLTPELIKRERGEETQALQTWAGEHPAAASAASILVSPASGLASMAGILGAKVTGQEIDPDSAWFALSNQKNAVREVVSAKVEENWGPAGGFLYNIGMSRGDMLADTMTGNPAGAMVFIGSRSFSESVIDAKNRGLSDEQALQLGVASAAAELLTERIGLDEMLKLPDGMQDAGFWKGAFRGAMGEAGEEGLTNLVNLVADVAIAGDKSEFVQKTEEYKAQGKDAVTASVMALKDAGISLALDAAGGFVSGGVFGGVDGWRSKRAADNAAKKEKAADNAAEEQTPSVSETGSAPAQGAGTGTPDSRAEASPGSLKEVVLNSVNPLVTRVMHTPLTQDIENRVSRAETDMEVMEATAAAYGVDTERVEQVRIAMELTGITRVVFDSGKRQNGKRTAGWFDRETRVIHLNPEASSPQLVVYGHEMTHRIEPTKGYKAFSRLVLERMEETGANLKQLREDKKAEYAQGGRQLADEDIDREIVAQYAAENLLSNEADIRALVNRNRTLGQRIRSWIDGWLAKFGNGKAKERQFLERARDLYVQALNESDRFDEQYVRSREREALLDRGEVDEEEAEYLRQLDEEDLSGDGDEKLREGMDLMLEDDSDGLTREMRNKLVAKKAIHISGQEWAMIRSQRKSRYSSMDESDIPLLDFFQIGDYRSINTSYTYIVRNGGPDNFSVVQKKLDRAEDTRKYRRKMNEQRQGVGRADGGADPDGSRRGIGVRGDQYSGNKTEFRKNDRGTENSIEADQNMDSGNSGADLGTGISGKADIQYALEEDDSGTEIPAAAKHSDFVPTMPMQVQRSLKTARNELVRTVGKALGISSENRNGALKQAAEDLNNEYIATGVTSQESVESFWDHAVSLAAKEPTEAVRAEFDEAIRKLERTQERATRYLNELYDTEVPEDGAEEESRTPPPPEPEKELTEEEAGALMKQCKQAKSRAARISRMAMLRESDREKNRLLLRGEIQTHELDPETDNVEDILEVYEAKKEYEELAKQVRQYKGQKGKLRREIADRMTRTALNWKDKKGGFWYSRETMERNIRDIVDSKRLAREIIETYFTPVHKAEAAKLRFKKELRARVEGLNISSKVANENTHSESYAVQFLGEALSHIQILKKSGNISARREGKTLREWEAEVTEFRKQNPNLDETSIKAKIQEFRKIYDELLDQVNTVRIRNGYEPVNRIEGYFPHFQMMEYTGFWGGVKKAMGFRADITPLPTTINGRTAGFKPGIRWMANAQERKGFQTTYDAVEGFERYLNSAADVIYLTDCIQNLRAFAEKIRYNASDEGLQKQVDRINADPSLDEEQRRAAIERVYKEGKFTASQFVTELDEYTNLLAGKRSAGDREMERLFGRGSYNFCKWAEQRTGANMVAANIGSALTNIIPMTQGFAVLKSKHFFQGMADTMRGEWKKDGFRGNSTFLTNRMGDSRINRTAMDKASEVAGWFMEWIDMLSAETITRGRYYQNLSRGMSELAAMDEADAWAAGLMGDRSKGGMPTIFEQTNPVAKLFTQFQLEVNNQFSFMLKDIPGDIENEIIKNIAAFLLKWLLGQYLFNDLYERFVGRRPAFDAMNLVNEFVGDMTGYELPNTFEAIGALMMGEPVNFKTEKEGAGGALKNFAVNVAEELPFTSAANLIGIEIDGGRVPAASAIPDLSVLGDVIGNPDWSWEKRWKELGEEAAKPLTYLLPPFGGGQGKKAVEAVGNYWNKGRYTMDANGNLLLQFPMSSVPEVIQAALFGSTSTDAGRAWVEGGFKNLNAKQTQAYKRLIDDGMSGEKAYEVIAALRHAEKTEEASRTQVQRQTLLGLDLTDQQKRIVYRALITEEREDDIAKFREAGMDMDDFLTAQIRHADIKAQYEDEGDMATAFAKWVNGQSWDKEQKATVRECFKYWNMTPANADRYDKALEAGLDDEAAFELTEDLKDLGKDPEEVQKWRVAIDDSWNEKGQLQRLKAVGMNDASYAKCEALWSVGVAPAAYVRAYELKNEFNEDGKGDLKNEEWTKLIESITTFDIVLPGDNTRFHLTAEQKSFLWQVLTGSPSTKNNPWGSAGGEKWLEIKKQTKGEEE